MRNWMLNEGKFELFKNDFELSICSNGNSKEMYFKIIVKLMNRTINLFEGFEIKTENVKGKMNIYFIKTFIFLLDSFLVLNPSHFDKIVLPNHEFKINVLYKSLSIKKKSKYKSDSSLQISFVNNHQNYDIKIILPPLSVLLLDFLDDYEFCNDRSNYGSMIYRKEYEINKNIIENIIQIKEYYPNLYIKSDGELIGKINLDNELDLLILLTTKTLNYINFEIYSKAVENIFDEENRKLLIDKLEELILFKFSPFIFNI